MAGRMNLEVQKALAAAKGNKTLAQRELITAALRDDELLRELVAPYLKAITAQAIERSLNNTAAPRATPPLGSGLNNLGKASIPKDLRAGYNPMRAPSGNEPELGERPAASGRHVSTLKLLAKAYEIKRGHKV